MNTKYIRLSILFLCIFSVKTFAQTALTGTVLKKADGGPIQGALVQIPDLKVSALTDSEGYYTFTDLPKGTYLVQVNALGFASAAQTSKAEVSEPLNFRLVISYVEENEVVVTGNAKATPVDNTPQPVTEVSHDYLMQHASANIIDALSQIPGVSGITDGQSISKPVIRGLGGNRVVTINDGVRQEGQQWGDEFGIEVDPFSVNRVEILKGPATLVYGSDAMAGVINFLPQKTMVEGEIKGEVIMGYQTNNGMISNAGNIAGNIKGVSFSSRIDNTMAYAYQNPRDGYVFNSQFSNFNTDHTIGLHRKWGFTQLHYSYFELRTGIAEGVKNEQGQFVKSALDENGDPIEVAATNQELRSYTPFVINQLVKHNKLVWDNSVSVGGGNIIARMGWQNNSRQENNDITMANTSNIWYKLNTFTYDLRYVSPAMGGFNFSTGVNGMQQNSKNKGTLLLIPEYDLFDFGAFAIANQKIGKLNLSAGIRYDNRSFHGHDNYIDEDGNQLSASDPGAIHRFTAYSSNFNGISGSLGAAFQVNENLYLKANVARGFRAPNVAESGSNGIKDGTVVYEVGQPTLKPEQNIEVDFTPGFKSPNVTAELSIFYNSISNFIYSKQLKAASGDDSLNSSTPGFENAPVFLYSQTDATLMGGELRLDIHPVAIRWFDWYTAYSRVDAKLKNVPVDENILAFVPPAHLRSEIILSTPKITNGIRNAYFRFGVFYSFEQSRPYQISSTYYGLDHIDGTPSYLLLNAGIGADIMNHGTRACSIYLNVDNIANLGYYDYMSRYKYAVNSINGVEQKYIYNMGRNVSVKVVVPIDFKHK